MFDFNDIAPLGHEDPSDDAKAFLENARRVLDYAFQPIVDIHNGTVFGYEALMRHHDKLGVETIFDVFDTADQFNILHRFDMMVRAHVISKFSKLPRNHRTRLFYNLDNRIITSPDYFRGGTKALLKQSNLPASILCLEISERHEVSMKMAENNLARYRGEDYSTAIDDFGAGYSGLKLLHEHQPDYIKIDRSLISGIDKDKKLKLMVSTMTDLAHVLGIFVIAEGVETEAQLAVCKEIGCDLVQGYFVCRPQLDPGAFSTSYPCVVSTGRRKEHKENEETSIIYEQIEYRPVLRIDDDMNIVFEAFRSNKEMTFFPVVDASGSPLGIVREHALKEYTYSPFGKDLIANRGAGLTLRKFLSACPVADIQASTQSILENYSLSESPEGIILVKDFSYLGFLSASSLLRVINENNLAQARDSSPLTKLPGNSSISSFVSDAVNDSQDATVLAYMDLDNFKAFNDAYGFRQGDRAILLFAELMRKVFQGENAFLGHVGGDDFFIGMRNSQLADVQEKVVDLLKCFSVDVESFYDAKAREQGYLDGKDRDGNPRQFPLMSCSAALLSLPSNREVGGPTFEDLDNAIAQLKKEAKASSSHMAVCCF
ncbi:GGDEF domain-containing protein [Terasakiella sp. A23]|uniref:GGDEF domain-containing protein n=1 Tax=Terasakiella sp. FCG-A23 TaxID=3080561 RepID=UPI00295583F6|nr:GGDEF domain-containing protein [Terasakiella sp. A23]MDV7339990.1 GGDEF domain-containing protein [Terasakiella sp. A23]